MNSRQKFKDLLRRDKLLVAPGCFDGLSARLVEEAGFEAAYLSGGLLLAIFLITGLRALFRLRRRLRLHDLAFSVVQISVASLPG